MTTIAAHRVGGQQLEDHHSDLTRLAVHDSRTSTLDLLADVAYLSMMSRQFEQAEASEIIQWAHTQYGSGLVCAASFQDCVLIDIVTQIVPGIEILFLDTQYHFAETLWYVEQVRARYNLNLTVLRPERALDDLWHGDPDACCRVRKVEPLKTALNGRGAWMSGLRRCETEKRNDAPIASWDTGKGLVKINPIVTWSDEDVATYINQHQLPIHPLSDKGYGSIGCWPCTRSVEDGEDARGGRWAGLDKTECGLHL